MNVVSLKRPCAVPALLVMRGDEKMPRAKMRGRGDGGVVT